MLGSSVVANFVCILELDSAINTYFRKEFAVVLPHTQKLMKYLQSYLTYEISPVWIQRYFHTASHLSALY